MIVPHDGALAVVPMRWQLIPPWWKKSLKELPATFNARAETVAVVGDHCVHSGEASRAG